MERSQEVRGCDRNRRLSKAEWERHVFWKPQKKSASCVQARASRPHRCIRRSRGTEPLLFRVSRKVERVLMSEKGRSSRIDAPTARSAVQADRQEWPAFLWDSSAGLLLPGAALGKVTTNINPHSCEMLGSSCHLSYCWDTHIRISGKSNPLCERSNCEWSTPGRGGHSAAFACASR